MYRTGFTRVITPPTENGKEGQNKWRREKAVRINVTKFEKEGVLFLQIMTIF